jgi:hypothetical protein
MVMKLFSLKTLFPIWLLGCGLFALFGSPMTLATGALLLMVGLLSPAVVIRLLWQDDSPTVAEALNRAEGSSTT